MIVVCSVREKIFLILSCYRVPPKISDRKSVWFTYDSCSNLYHMMTAAVICSQPAPKEAANRTIHARLSKGDAVLMASDTMPNMPVKVGDNVQVSVQCESDEEIERLAEERNSQVPSETAAPTADEAAKPKPEPTTSRQFAFVRKATHKNGKLSLVVDFAQFLSGDAAAEARRARPRTRRDRAFV